MRHLAWLALAALWSGPAWADVFTMEGLREALAAARPGEVIGVGPGTYLVDHTIEIRRPGAAGQPIVLRALKPGSVVFRVTAPEAFRVDAPHWVFENLVLEGVCADDGECEHAFHVTGAARQVVLRGNRLTDFNSPVKVNGQDGAFPDGGLMEGNRLANRRARRTGNPVTGIDIVGASDWVVRGNLIADFVKDGGNRTSYGAFMKGGGEGGVFEGNVVACRRTVAAQATDEARIGLSFGGGGTEDRYCRGGTCRHEHKGGVMTGNLVLGCSDVGIYLNRAAETRVSGGILYRTAGIDVRFPASTAELRDTVLDGRIRQRDGGRFTETGTRSMSAADWERFQGPCKVLAECEPQDLARR